MNKGKNHHPFLFGMVEGRVREGKQALEKCVSIHPKGKVIGTSLVAQWL